MTREVVPVLLYHSISDTAADPWSVDVVDFRRDMEQVVASGRTTLTAAAYGAGLRGETTLPPSPLLITFDDGFADSLDVAAPILAELGLAATVFVTTGYLGRERMLSPAGLRELAAVDGVEIGSHSVSHPHLDVIRGERSRHEIEESKRGLEELLGRAVESFAYPHGSHRGLTRAQVAAAGYRTAHAVKNQLSHTGDDDLAVARFTVHRGTRRAEVARVTGGTGLSVARPGERWQTSAYRLVRGARAALATSR